MTNPARAEDLAHNAVERMRLELPAGPTMGDVCDHQRNVILAILRTYGAAIRARDAEVSSEEFPSNWCDPLLTGPEAKLKIPATCPDIERYTAALKDRCTAAISAEPLP